MLSLSAGASAPFSANVEEEAVLYDVPETGTIFLQRLVTVGSSMSTDRDGIREADL